MKNCNQQLFSFGWHDNTLTNHREYWCESRKGRHGHKSGIAPDSIHKEFRAPWLTYPDVPRAYQASQFQPSLVGRK